MPSFSFPGEGQLPDELVIFVPFALIAVIGLVLLAGRGEDAGGNAVRARYFGAIAILTLFITLFAAYATAQALTDLMVDHEDRVTAAQSDLPPELQQVFDALYSQFPFDQLSEEAFGSKPYLTSPNNDANYTAAVESGMIALAAGGLLAINLAVRRRAWPGDSAANSPTARVDTVARFGVIFVASLSAALAFASVGVGIYKLAVPGTAGAVNEDVGRAEGGAEALAALLLLAGSLVIVRGVVQRLRSGPVKAIARER
jgi:hypothetical protein